jgi:ribosome-associated protein
MVEGYFTIRDSQRLTELQKERLLKKLSGKLNSNGELRVKSQAHRSQLQNKADVIRKINTLLEAGLKKEKKRIATQASKAKKRAAHKRDRRKPGQEAE